MIRTLLVVCGVALCAAIAMLDPRTESEPVTDGVGTRPGDVGKSKDIWNAARSRGNELALFAVG